MKRRWTAALLALVLMAALLPATAQAAQVDRSAGARLTGADRDVYNVLRTEVEKIANGSRTGTRIQVPDLGSLSWTMEELGASWSDQDAAMAKLKAKLLDTLHIELIYTALTLDCPYEMFWRGLQYSFGCSYVLSGTQAYIQDLTVYLQPSQGYLGVMEYTLDPAKVAAAHQAAANANAIVDKYQGLSDYEKLNAYRKEICQLVSYEYSAPMDGYHYGDPWQLVSVFDGNPSTNVVCEGYSKAFKYLCDLSRFDGDITCYIATGTLDNGSHMWNVVRMDDGQNYLVDVTNCDSGMVGADDKLFLAGAATSNGGQSHTISLRYDTVTYAYQDQQKDLFTDGYLVLSTKNYDPSAQPATPVEPDQPSAPTEPDQPAAPAEPDQPSTPAEPSQPATPSDPVSGIPSFTDVKSNDYFVDYVAWAVERQIAKGTTETTFSPKQDCTQVQILTFLWRAAGEPGSSAELPVDITGKNVNYAEGALRWAAEKGMIDETFDLSAKCTRASAVAYIWQAFDCPKAEAAAFTDVAADADYAEAVAWAVAKKVTLGRTETTFDPDAVCNRAEIVTFLYRAYH